MINCNNSNKNAYLKKTSARLYKIELNSSNLSFKLFFSHLLQFKTRFYTFIYMINYLFFNTVKMIKSSNKRTSNEINQNIKVFSFYYISVNRSPPVKTCIAHFKAIFSFKPLHYVLTLNSSFLFLTFEKKIAHIFILFFCFVL